MARQFGGKTYRTRTSLNIYLGGDGPSTVRYKIDLSPDAAHHAIRFGEFLAGLEHLLITHTDSDHLSPDLLAWRKRPISGVESLLPLNLWGTRAVMDLLRERGVDFAKCRILSHIIEPAQHFSAGELDVLAVAGRHTPDEPCLNYVVSAEGRTALFAWDTGIWTEATWQVVRGLRFDAVFLECTVNGVEGEYPSDMHQNVDSFLRMKKRMAEEGMIASTTPFVSVHMGDNGLISHEEAQSRFDPYGVTVGYDGLLIEI
jgi:phosphoribosyl 1,2-cyclic phosphate phosphodiesterase